MKTKEEQRAYNNAWYAKRSPEQKAEKQRKEKERAFVNIKAVHDYKAEKGCMDCGEKDPIVLEFDHRIRADKSFDISNALRLGTSIDKILVEMEKCDVVCANCHRRRTALQMNWTLLRDSTNSFEN